MAPLGRRGFLGMMGALAVGQYLSTRGGPTRFPLVAGRKAAPLVVSSTDHPGVVRAARDLQADIERVTGVRPGLYVDHVPAVGEVVLIGSLDASPLVRAVGLDTTGIAGRWETSLTEAVARSGQRTLVVTGSDQRGTIYGIYEISRQIGVSPWYWWDDVPPQHRDELHVLPGRHSLGTPAVKYRGLFINDENPALGTWAPACFGPGLAPGYPGGFNHAFYEKIFETMLRLRANYLWPAVWGRAFAEDDPLNHATAKRYGVVMGTSHEAPMMRGIEEWNRHAVPAVRDADGTIVTPGHDPYGGTGEWSFRHNADAVKAYWADGIRRMVTQDFEGVVTVGMRGTGDTRLPDGDSIDLMRDILAAERKILADVTGRDPATVPQVWTLYTEVMRYWVEGLRPADDVTVVFPDDNWGNLRKLPDPGLPPRPGGYGLYYHFDFVGPGRCYKWNDTSVIANTWEQLNQAFEYGITRLWVANVGDFKGNELPLQFFLDYAWDPAALPLSALPTWERRYAEQNFGAGVADELGALLHDYGRLQALRKPELLNRHISVTADDAIVYDDQASPYSLVDYGELDRVTDQWAELATRARQIGDRLPAAARDAYFELVQYEVASMANLHALRRAEFTNILYAGQGRAPANDLADEAEARFAQDLALADRFNTDIAGGKWRGFQMQPHIDYGDVARYGPDAPWQQPQINNVALPDVLFPAVRRIPLAVDGALGVAVDGSTLSWPGAADPAVLPEFSPFQSQPDQYLDVFNRGSKRFTYRLRWGAPWLVADKPAGVVDGQVRVTFHVDWRQAPKGTTTVPVVVTGAGESVTVRAVVANRELPAAWGHGFVEANGYVSVDADHPTANIAAHGVTWQRIPDIGRHGAGMKPFPVTATSQPAGSGPRLEYRMSLFTAGTVTVWAYLSPRNDVLPTPGLRYAVAFDDQSPQVVDVIAATGSDSTALNRAWERNTSDNINLTSTRHTIIAPGPHTLKFWMVDPTVVVQKLVVDTGGLRPSYLGPPESRRL
ncbi:glycosyl hydrolase family 115 (putative glucuronidase) [Kutzneria buriramensis]|uniref:Glycosyl hydrolase family 115 (Putative glucuronidase) n=1 Tax=Kutzneria buriramensis TaxID=1045776 RepID=A0A3E0GW89_9PSEU|nr:glycosyl hydrolase family 115 (putative glucuronidase) [Kutzneria buriramensis]